MDLLDTKSSFYTNWQPNYNGAENRFIYVPVHECFNQMSTLHPDGYAFAVRGAFDLQWIIRIACTLSFLYSKGIKKVHMLGSSRREVMVLGAAAIGLGMFEQLSFDSRTWNTRIWNGPSIVGSKYYDCSTMKWQYVGNDSPDILVSRRMLQNGELPKIKNEQHLMQILMLQNASAISYQAERMAAMAQNFIAYREFINNQFGGKPVAQPPTAASGQKGQP